MALVAISRLGLQQFVIKLWHLLIFIMFQVATSWMFYNVSPSLFSRFLVVIKFCCHDACIFIFIIFHVSVLNHHLCFFLPFFSFVEWCNNFQSESQINSISFISLLIFFVFYNCCCLLLLLLFILGWKHTMVEHFGHPF